MTPHPPPIARIFPASIRSRLLKLSIKAELAAQESPFGRNGAAYQAVIEKIDQAQEEARKRCPHLFRYDYALTKVHT